MDGFLLMSPTNLHIKSKETPEKAGWTTRVWSPFLVLIVFAAPVAVTAYLDSTEYLALGTEESGSDPAAVAASELEEAVSSAVGAIIESEAYAVRQVTYHDDRVASSQQVLHRADGSFEIIREIDPPVVHELTSIGVPDRPVAEVDHEYEESAIFVHVNGVVYTGREGGTWKTLEVSPMFRPVAVDLVGMATGEYIQTDGESTFGATVTLTQNGEAVWSYSAIKDGSTVRQIWDVDSDGYLRSYVLEFPQRAFRGEITFTPLTEPPAIEEPKVGEAVDPQALGLASLDALP